jgi:hypothetical protein
MESLTRVVRSELEQTPSRAADGIRSDDFSWCKWTQAFQIAIFDQDVAILRLP